MKYYPRLVPLSVVLYLALLMGILHAQTPIVPPIWPVAGYGDGVYSQLLKMGNFRGMPFNVCKVVLDLNNDLSGLKGTLESSVTGLLDAVPSTAPSQAYQIKSASVGEAGRATAAFLQDTSKSGDKIKMSLFDNVSLEAQNFPAEEFMKDFQVLSQDYGIICDVWSVLNSAANPVFAAWLLQSSLGYVEEAGKGALKCLAYTTLDATLNLDNIPGGTGFLGYFNSSQAQSALDCQKVSGGATTGCDALGVLTGTVRPGSGLYKSYLS